MPCQLPGGHGLRTVRSPGGQRSHTGAEGLVDHQVTCHQPAHMPCGPGRGQGENRDSPAQRRGATGCGAGAVVAPRGVSSPVGRLGSLEQVVCCFRKVTRDACHSARSEASAKRPWPAVWAGAGLAGPWLGGDRRGCTLACGNWHAEPGLLRRPLRAPLSALSCGPSGFCPFSADSRAGRTEIRPLGTGYLADPWRGCKGSVVIPRAQRGH